MPPAAIAQVGWSATIDLRQTAHRGGEGLMSESAQTSVDFAVVAYREEGSWQVVALPPRAAGDLDTLLHALRQWPGDSGSLGMVCVDEDFFVLARIHGSDVRLLLSDITAASEWPLARGILDRLQLPAPGDDDAPEPAGDLGLVSDLGFDAMAMGSLIDDAELYPDEMLTDMAARMGFGAQFELAVDTVVS
jgi:putative tRNA adenosine deaminase-associated protein